MPWKIALAVALVTGLATAMVAGPLADKVAGMRGVSDFEGQRAYLIVFIIVPAAFLLGALLGLLGTRLMDASTWAHFWKAAGVSLLMGQIAIWGIAGLNLLQAPRAPKVAGEDVSLEVEFHVPLSLITPRSREPDQIRVSLYSGPKDNSYGAIDRSLYREEDDDLIVTAVVPLRSKSHSRTLSFLIEDHTWLAYDLAGLSAVPKSDNFEWSELAPMRNARNADDTEHSSGVRLRWRVAGKKSSV